MIRDKVIDSLGRIDDELIQGVEVLRAKPRRIKRFRWVAVAACLCIIFALTIPMFLGNGIASKPGKLNLEGAVLEIGAGSVEYHTDNYPEHYLAFTIVLEQEIPECYLEFTTSNIWEEWVDEDGVVHQETEEFKIVSTAVAYEEYVSYTVVDDLLTFKVNGIETTRMPSEPGTYEIEIDYDNLYDEYDVVENRVAVWPFGELVTNSAWFAE